MQIRIYHIFSIYKENRIIYTRIDDIIATQHYAFNYISFTFQSIHSMLSINYIHAQYVLIKKRNQRQTIQLAVVRDVPKM